MELELAGDVGVSWRAELSYSNPIWKGLTGMDRRDFNKMVVAAMGGIMAGAAIGGCSTGDKKEASTQEMEKHACKGRNSCKGNGGCKTATNECKGKNACKGQGGCATVAHHDCAGKNACKGLGGCGSGDGGCAGHNSCKGHGGCAVPIKSKK